MNEYETFYFAKYRDMSIPIAISNVKDLVKEYMEVHRNVKPKDYIINDGNFKPAEIQSEFPYALIEQYEDWYIPAIDIEIITVNKNKIEDIIDNTISGLKTIILSTQDIKKIPDSDRNTLIKSMQIINNFKNKKKVWNKIVDNYKLSELLFMDMDSYWSTRCIYIEMKETRQRWDFMIEDKGGDVNEENEE